MPGVLGTLADWVRPRLVNHQLTDADFVRALRRAADNDVVVAVYDDETAPYATAARIERELDVSLPADRRVRLPAVVTRGFAPGGRTVRACALVDADPPVVLLSRDSLQGWDEATRNFVVAHEFGHALADPPPVDATVESLRPLPAQSTFAVRELVVAYREYRAGEVHADLRAELPERYRISPDVMATYHEAERAGEDGVLVSERDRRALAARNAAKYLPLPYDPPGVPGWVRAGLARSFPEYCDTIVERLVTAG